MSAVSARNQPHLLAAPVAVAQEERQISAAQIHALDDLTVKLAQKLKSFPASGRRSKLHYLLHLGDSIRRFGCAFAYDVELFEALNKHCRRAITSSNNFDDSRAAALYWSKKDITTYLLQINQ
jgi:hypothetical protein